MSKIIQLIWSTLKDYMAPPIAVTTISSVKFMVVIIIVNGLQSGVSVLIDWIVSNGLNVWDNAYKTMIKNIVALQIHGVRDVHKQVNNYHKHKAVAD